MMKIGVVSGAAAALVWAVVALVAGSGGLGVSVAAVLEPVALASGEAPAAHIVMRARTRPGEDFEFVDPDGPWQTVEAWVEWPAPAGRSARALISKGDRIYACDGRTMITYHPPRGEAMRTEGCAMDLELFRPEAWVRTLQGVRSPRVHVLRLEDEGLVGRILLGEPGVGRAGERESFWVEFDRETEVEWDRETHRLTGLRRWVLQEGRRLVAETVTVEYLDQVDDAVFDPRVPADVVWVGLREAPPELAGLGPREVALQFLQAAARGDSETMELLGASPHVAESILRMGIVEAVSVGAPFRGGAYAGVYVPYRIRLGREGHVATREFRLALRNDNPAKRWIFDGGL